jgi:hypothetical protein
LDRHGDFSPPGGVAQSGQAATNLLGPTYPIERAALGRWCGLTAANTAEPHRRHKAGGSLVIPFFISSSVQPAKKSSGSGAANISCGFRWAGAVGTP